MRQAGVNRDRFGIGRNCIDKSSPVRIVRCCFQMLRSLLNSLEYLVNRVFRTGRESKISSIVLDSESYRQHREAELVLLAHMASQKVVSQQKPLSLQPMTPRERRIVHLALAMIQGVRSQSEGDGESRSITIYPSCFLRFRAGSRSTARTPRP